MVNLGKPVNMVKRNNGTTAMVKGMQTTTILRQNNPLHLAAYFNLTHSMGK